LADFAVLEDVERFFFFLFVVADRALLGFSFVDAVSDILPVLS